MAEIRIVVAGREMTDPFGTVMSYIKDYRRTCKQFDLQAGTYDTLTVGVIRSTQIVHSRISRSQGEWFVQRALTAPWDLVPSGAQLVDAAPEIEGGLYDNALALWRHFMDDPGIPARVSTGKISKVLHLMRPHFFPILDSRVSKRYQRQGREAALRLARTRPDLGVTKRAYWAAIRDDVEQSAAGLDALRRRVKESDVELARDWAHHVSDVRLHDLLIWSSRIRRST